VYSTLTGAGAGVAVCVVAGVTAAEATVGCGAGEAISASEPPPQAQNSERATARTAAAVTARGKGLLLDRVTLFIHRLFDRRELGQTRVVFHDDELAFRIAGDEADAGDFFNGRMDCLDAMVARNIGGLKRCSFQVIDLRCV
jgi:hypothetical protein